MEILTFLLSCIDREKSDHALEHTPIAYALKGSSLKVDTMWKMIDKVRDECKAKDIKILCECCDGQWWWYNDINYINQYKSNDINGNPLTHMQYQKRKWNEVLTMKKKTCLHIYCNVRILVKIH